MDIRIAHHFVKYQIKAPDKIHTVGRLLSPESDVEMRKILMEMGAGNSVASTKI